MFSWLFGNKYKQKLKDFEKENSELKDKLDDLSKKCQDRHLIIQDQIKAKEKYQAKYDRLKNKLTQTSRIDFKKQVIDNCDYLDQMELAKLLRDYDLIVTNPPECEMDVNEMAKLPMVGSDKDNPLYLKYYSQVRNTKGYDYLIGALNGVSKLTYNKSKNIYFYITGDKVFSSTSKLQAKEDFENYLNYLEKRETEIDRKIRLAKQEAISQELQTNKQKRQKLYKDFLQEVGIDWNKLLNYPIEGATQDQILRGFYLDKNIRRTNMSKLNINNQAHFILSGKGGVGKTTITTLLMDERQTLSDKVIGFDPDSTNSSLFQNYKKKGLNEVNYMPVGGLNDEGDFTNDKEKSDQLDNLIVKIQESQPACCVVDCGAGSFESISDKLLHSNGLENLQDDGINVVAHVLINSGGSIQDTVKDTVNVIEAIDGRCPFVLWAVEREDTKFKDDFHTELEKSSFFKQYIDGKAMGYIKIGIQKRFIQNYFIDFIKSRKTFNEYCKDIIKLEGKKGKNIANNLVAVKNNIFKQIDTALKPVDELGKKKD